jgi:putative transposase
LNHLVRTLQQRQRESQAERLCRLEIDDETEPRRLFDGKIAWIGTLQHLWRSVKYEEVYLRAYETVSQAREGISRYLSFFNTARPHTAHGGKTPDSAYFAALPAIREAA